jgi:hypothetical protein
MFLYIPIWIKIGAQIKGTLLEELSKLNIWPLLVFVFDTDFVVRIVRTEAEEGVEIQDQAWWSRDADISVLYLLL